MAQQVINSEQKIWAAASYLWIISLVVLASRKKDDYIRFHAAQGLMLFILSVVFMITPLTWLLEILIMVAAITGIIKALKGERWELPLVGKWAQSLSDWVIKTLKL